MTVAQATLTVVVVDDAPDVRMVVSGLLRHSGAFAVVGEGGTGTEAVALAAAHQPDVVLLDVSMPGMDGLEALPRVLRASPASRVVMFSGFAHDGVARAALDAGAAGYLEKATPPTELAGRLVDMVRGHHPASTAGSNGDEGAGALLAEHGERFRTAFDQAAIGMAVLTLAGQVVRANAALCALVGRAERELVARPFVQLVDRHDREPLAASFSRLAGGTAQSEQLEHRLAAGAPPGTWAATAAAVVTDGRGEPLYLFCQVQDITGRKRAEEESHLLQALALTLGGAERLEDAFAMTLERVCTACDWAYGSAWLIEPDGSATPAAAWPGDVEGPASFARRRAALSLPPGAGLSGRAWATGTPVWVTDLAAEPGFAKAEDARAARVASAMAVPVLAGREVVAVLEFFLRERREEDRRQVSVVSAVAAQLGEVVKRRRAEETLRAGQVTSAELARRARHLERLNAELRRSNEDLEQFAALASHDLRTPLVLITGYLDTVQRLDADRLDDQGRELLGRAVAAGWRMDRLIDDVLAWSHAGESAPATPVDCARLVGDVLADLAPAIDRTGARVTTGPLPTVPGDPARLRLLFGNLVANGLQFARPGSTPRVVVEAESSGTCWTFSVSDDGVGVPDDDRERIFDMFQRAHREGNGIGLATARRVVEAHGGRIWVEDRPGGGTRFLFTLPAA